MHIHGKCDRRFQGIVLTIFCQKRGCQRRFYRKDLLEEVFISVNLLDKFGKKSLIRISFVRKFLLENRFSEEFYQKIGCQKSFVRNKLLVAFCQKKVLLVAVCQKLDQGVILLISAFHGPLAEQLYLSLFGCRPSRYGDI